MSESQQKKSGNVFVDYFKDFSVLKETRLEYWGIQIINFLDSTIFFAVLTVSVLMLSEDFGFSDVNAGYVITLYGSATTLCLFFSGAIGDWLGIRMSFYVSMVGLLITRGAIVLVAIYPDFMPDYRNAIIVTSYGLMAPFVAMVITVFQAANRRFTTKRSRSAGFNLWYLFMNVGAALGGYMIDIVHKHLEWAYVHIFSIGCVAAVLCIIVTFLTVRREDQLHGPDEQPDESDGDAPKERKRPWEILGEVLAHKVFWKFVVLISLMLGVRSVFLYMHLLMPKFWLRVIGPDASIGALEAVNPILVIIGLILLIPVLHRFSVYNMLVWGSMISAISLFIIGIPVWGVTVYWTSIASLVVLTIGEVIWSPRLNEYTAAIAPRGQEGTYLGLSMLPYFAAKTLVGLASGHMLARWCPEFPEGTPIMRDRLAQGEIPFWDSPSAMWLILALFAICGPIMALIFRRWFTQGAHFETHEEVEGPREAELIAEAGG